MTNEIELVSEKLASAFQYLAEKAGIATEYFWPIFVRQQFAEGLGPLLVCLLIITIVGISAFAVRKIEYFEEGTSDPTAKLFIHIVGGVITFFMIMAIAFEGASWVTHMINPEYYAIQDLMRMIK